MILWPARTLTYLFVMWTSTTQLPIKMTMISKMESNLGERHPPEQSLTYMPHPSMAKY